jgi:hypothetical protein
MTQFEFKSLYTLPEIVPHGPGAPTVIEVESQEYPKGTSKGEATGEETVMVG